MVSIVAKTSKLVSQNYQYIVGVDTHARKHVFVIINNLGECVGKGECRVTSADFRHTLLLINRKTKHSRVLFAIEGTSSYGETFAQYLMNEGMEVCEVKPPKTKSRGSTGKSDQIDAEMAARSILFLPIDKLARPRTGEQRKILRILLGTRNNLVKQQTMDKNALIALVRSLDVGVDARRPLNIGAIREIASSRTRNSDAHHEAVARNAAKMLAVSILERGEQLQSNEISLGKAIKVIAPSLLDQPGIGPVCAAQILCAYSHKGRVTSPEAFCSIAGVAPIPASSGNTTHHRLSRFGDRALNHALNIIALARMRTDEETMAYVEKCTKLGKDRKEIKRTLKRYIARSMFKLLETLNLGVD